MTHALYTVKTEGVTSHVVIHMPSGERIAVFEDRHWALRAASLLEADRAKFGAVFVSQPNGAVERLRNARRQARA